MVNPMITQTVSRSSGLFGKLFGFLLKYKLASIFIIYLVISIISFGFSTGDWTGAVIKVGEELVNPLEDASNRIADLNGGVTGLIDSVMKYLLLYFAFYKIWLWFRLVLWVVNFLMKDANSPFIRIIVTALIFIPFFYSASSFYSATVLGESMFYPFTLTKEIFNGLIDLFLNLQFSWKFDIFGEAVNNCTSSTCIA